MAELWQKLDRAFNPKVLVVVGDKAINEYEWLKSYQSFTGKLYSVQIDEREIPGIEALGITNYKSIKDIPEPIDHVLFAVPRQVSPYVLADCIEIGAGSVCLFTSGFAETGEPAAVELQAKVTQMALDAEMPLIGPNCMGIYVPKLGIRQGWHEQPLDSGPVGLISQSGTHSMFVASLMQNNGVGISKGVSIGNSVILDASDYLEYLAEDAETEIIAAYIEGVRNGRRFFETLRRVARKKPVVIWKGGATEAGARATASHTASLATSSATWNAMMRQCGAIAVDTIDELVDVCKALLFVKPGTGTRVGLMAMTGGPSVAMTDAFAREGLNAPPLTEASYAKLSEFFNVIGGSYRNPLDIGGTLQGEVGNLARMFEILEEDENIDTIVMDVAAGFAAQRWRDNPGKFDELVAEIVAHKARSNKPFLTTMHPMWYEEIVATLRPKIAEKGVASFHSFDRAARALRQARDYWTERA